MTYKIKFSRYANGESRISVPQFIDADDFLGAVSRAEDILRGLAEGDPSSRFHIVSIEGHGVYGKQCDGALMFETSEELSGRVKETA